MSRLLKTRLSIDGLNQLRLIKTLTGEGIRLFNVQKIANNRLKITIKSSFKAKAIAILEKLCYNYCVEWDYSVQSLFSALLYRVGLAAGCIAGAALCWVLSSAVAFVKIEGLSTQSELMVKRLICDNFDLPAFRKSVDVTMAKSLILSSGQAADCIVKVKGNYLVVEALPMIMPEENSTAKSAIVATRDAVVTRVITLDGTPLVKSGQVVKKGDALVSGEIYDSAGENVLRTVTPDAVIYGEVVERFTKTVCETRLKVVRTGKKCQKRFLLLPYQAEKFPSPYEQFDVEVEEGRLSALLPLTYRKITYYETKTELVSVDIEAEAEAFFKESAASVPYGIKKSSYDIIDLFGGVKKISVYVVRETIIS